MDYKNQIAKEIQTLKKQLTDLGVKNPIMESDWIPLPHDVTDFEPDPNVVADRSEDWLETRGTTDVLETRLNNLIRAYKKIAEQTFGYCEICQKPIETDRLDVNPAARTCKEHINEEANLTE